MSELPEKVEKAVLEAAHDHHFCDPPQRDCFRCQRLRAAIREAIEEARHLGMALADKRAADMVKSYDDTVLGAPARAMRQELIDYFTQAGLVAERMVKS